MNRKYISKTYLRDVSKYEFKLFMDEMDYYIGVKKLIKVDVPFIIRNDLCVMDNEYYVFEVIPKNKNYAMRLFLDNKKKPLEYYFDICKNNGIDKNSLIPFFDDLYLDVTVNALDNEVKVLDEDELDEAFKTNDITNDEYELAIKTKDKLLKEIENNSNELMKIDFLKYLF